MAGSQDPNENPVAINVVPMVDVIFCLCVFFMCSFKFKQVEGRFDTWLPSDRGLGPVLAESIVDEIRVALILDEATGTTQRKFVTRFVPADAELERLIREAQTDLRSLHTEPRVTIDADTRVPWREVVTVLNLSRRAGVQRIEFAYGAPPVAVR